MGFIERYFLNDVNETPQPVDTPPSPTGGGIVPREKYTQDTINLLQVQQNNDEKSIEIIINIIAEISGEGGGATVLNNGVPLEGSTPKRYSIKKTDLFEKGPQTIELRKFGYISNTKYVFSVTTRGEVPEPIEQVQILQDEKNPEKLIGLERLIVSITKFVDDNREEFLLENGNFANLPFRLRRAKDSGIDISLPES